MKFDCCMGRAKRSRDMMPIFQHLPEDLILEILSRLPVRSLLQFKTVCMRWKSLISDKDFRLCNVEGRREKSLFFYGRGENKSYLSINHELDHVEVFENPFSGCDFLGTCDGLMLFGYGKNIYLWNPSTNYFKPVHHLDSLGQAYNRRLASGFCYDKSVNDYKIVIIISQITKRATKINVFFSHLKSVDWRKIGCSFDVFRTDMVAPLVSGNLHFLAKEETEKNTEKVDQYVPQSIIYFDTKRDEIKLLPKPESKHDAQNIVYGFGVIKECLCIIRPDKDCTEILTMKEYGVKESWTIIFTIASSCLNYRGYSLVPVFFTNKEEVVMVENHRKIIAYNLKKKSLSIIGMPKSLEDCNFFGFTYVESMADGNADRPVRKKRSNKLDDFLYCHHLNFM